MVEGKPEIGSGSNDPSTGLANTGSETPNADGGYPGTSSTDSAEAENSLANTVEDRFPSRLSVDIQDDSDFQGYDENDSALGDSDGGTYDATATSSIYDYVEKHGRTYHRYKEGKYVLPNDSTEQSRLDLQHEIIYLILGNNLHLAPVERPSRVLDVGTGTGTWAIEFADRHPESEVLGTDLSPIQPAYLPPNCRFEVDDVDDEWVFSRPFDFIFLRFMNIAVRDFPRTLRSIYTNLTPGGFVEIQDFTYIIRSMNDKMRGTVLAHWMDLLLQCFVLMGNDLQKSGAIKGQMEAEGFVDIHEKKLAIPISTWPKEQKQKMVGSMMLENLLVAAHGICIRPMTTQLGMTEEEVELMLVDVRKDLKNPGLHCFISFVVLYGRKPFETVPAGMSST